MEFEQFLQHQQLALHQVFQLLREILTERKTVAQAKLEYREFLRTNYSKEERNRIIFILQQEPTPKELCWLRDLYLELLTNIID